jgi:anaerobic selenocysteine-containing dehydrogenase
MLSTHASVCPLDCPDRCSLTVTVEDGRVRRIGGSHENGLTAGWICSKVARFDRRVYGPERVLHPMIRRGDGFVRATWDEAMTLIADRMRAALAAHGGESILPCWYGGSNGYVTGGGLDQRLWAVLGATRIDRTWCAANAGAAVRAVYGDLPSADPADAAHAASLTLWGVNPSASGIHLVPLARDVLARGGELIVVDPRRTPLAAEATLHLAPLPGTDVALAMAVHHLAFARGWADRAFLAAHAADAAAWEEAVTPWTPVAAAAACDVPAAKIEELAERYAAASPALLRCGWGVERTRNGTDAIRAIVGLAAVYGKMGVRGGGWCMSTSGGYGTDKSRIGLPAPATRVVNLAQIGRAIEELADPPVRVVWVYNANPVASAPDQDRVRRALARDDVFVVVHEQSWTDSCDVADVVLPATTFLEHQELSRSYGGYLFQWAEPVIPPVGEARPNHAVFAELADRLGLDHPALRATPEDIAREVLAATPNLPADGWDQLRAGHALKLRAPIQHVDAFGSAPIRLVGDAAPRLRPPPCDADRSLILVSPASPRGISSTLFETLPPGEAVVRVHRTDADAAGLAEGDVVEVFNSVGVARLLLKLDDALRPGVVEIAKGVWRRSTLNGSTANALVPDHVDERGGGACYNDARVDLRRAAPEAP